MTIVALLFAAFCAYLVIRGVLTARYTTPEQRAATKARVKEFKASLKGTGMTRKERRAAYLRWNRENLSLGALRAQYLARKHATV